VYTGSAVDASAANHDALLRLAGGAVGTSNTRKGVAADASDAVVGLFTEPPPHYWATTYAHRSRMGIAEPLVMREAVPPPPRPKSARRVRQGLPVGADTARIFDIIGEMQMPAAVSADAADTDGVTLAVPPLPPPVPALANSDPLKRASNASLTRFKRLSNAISAARRLSVASLAGIHAEESDYPVVQTAREPERPAPPAVVEAVASMADGSQTARPSSGNAKPAGRASGEAPKTLSLGMALATKKLVRAWHAVPQAFKDSADSELEQYMSGGGKRSGRPSARPGMEDFVKYLI
jgi:hypothetical protein